MVAWEAVEDSRPQSAKALEAAGDSHPQPSCVDLPGLPRLLRAGQLLGP
jgi:hypothetical protein